MDCRFDDSISSTLAQSSGSIRARGFLTNLCGDGLVEGMKTFQQWKADYCTKNLNNPSALSKSDEELRVEWDKYVKKGLASASPGGKAKQERLLEMMEEEQKASEPLTKKIHSPQKESSPEESGPTHSTEQRIPSRLDFAPVERRSGWAVLQCVCGTLCLVIGLFVLASDNVKDAEKIYAILFLAAGVQAFFIAFLINVFTDIRWFLQENLKAQKESGRR